MKEKMILVVLRIEGQGGMTLALALCSTFFDEINFVEGCINN